MSCIIDFAEATSYTTNILNGFDIVGFENSESILQKDRGYENPASATFSDLAEKVASFDFIDYETEEQGTTDLESKNFIEASELIETTEHGELIGKAISEDGFQLEFFSEGVNILASGFAEGENSVFIQGVSSDADIEYDEASGTLSIDGQEIAHIDVASDLNNNNYEIF